MINLNSYKIDKYTYTVGDTANIANDILRIDAIVNINENVFFFCSKSSGYFKLNVSSSTSLQLTINPMHALSFHHHNMLSLRKTE